VLLCVLACFCYFNHGQQGQQAKSGRAYGNKLSIFNYARDVWKPPSWPEPPFCFSDSFSDMANTFGPLTHTHKDTHNGPQIPMPETEWDKSDILGDILVTPHLIESCGEQCCPFSIVHRMH